MKEGELEEGAKSLEVMNRLKSFRAPKRLQLEAMTFLANNLPNSAQLDMTSLRRVFKTMDTDKTGFVTTENIENALKQMDIT